MSNEIELNVENIYNYLASIANYTENTITYGRLEEKCGMDHHIKNLQKLTDVLNLTIVYNHLRNEPLLALLVVNSEKIPGKGFYRTLGYLGIDVQDERDFHLKEIQKIKKYNWKKYNLG